MKKRSLIITLATLALSSFMTMSVFAAEWVQEGEYWKYKDDNGAFVVSDWKFLKYGQNYAYFYFDELGHMCTGLKKLGNDYYSFNADGSANSNSTVNVNGTEYKTKNKGIMIDTFKPIDVDAYNAAFKAAHAAKTAEQIAAEQVAAAEAAVKEEVRQAAVEDNEKRGPRSKAAQAALAENSDKYNGPGVVGDGK